MSARGLYGRMRAGRRRLIRGGVLGIWSRLPSTIDRLMLVPNDLGTPDPSFVVEAAAGVYNLGGVMIDAGRESPFALDPGPGPWLDELNGFGWLRNLTAAGEPRAIELARRLVADWIDRNRRAAGPAWRPEIVADRVSAWLVNAHLLLDGADARFYGSVMTSLGRQMRRLDGLRHRAPPGEPAIRCLVALLEAVLATGAGDHHLARLEAELADELQRQVLVDGCHVSRNPSVTLQLLAKLLPLRLCYRERKRQPPEPLQLAVRRMLAFMARMQLGDGSIARFNGAGRTPFETIATVLTFQDGQDDAPPWGGRGGYARLARGETVVIADAGCAPPLEHAGTAHAGCLAFEMSFGEQAVLRNCGAPARPSAEVTAAARSTAAHNTLVLGERSSGKLAAPRPVGSGTGAAPVTGPLEVTSSGVASDEGVTFTAGHDGYAADLGYLHERTLTLSEDGRRLSGTDRLRPAKAGGPSPQPVAIHFHLATGGTAELEADGRSASIRLPAGPLWRLTVSNARAVVEASTDYSHPSGGERGLQIVLRTMAHGDTAVSWTLQALD